MTKKVQQENASFRPPIVAVLGHVDHGKTTLLDTIRKTTVAQHEHGGITQHIGAYQVTISEVSSRPNVARGGISKGSLDPSTSLRARDDRMQEHTITFIDTPGHEAFAKMRSRGANVADIALLVVAANDSVMPQTKESIEMIKKAGASMIVVLNKIDLPVAAPAKVKADLAKAGVQVEGFGGDIPMAPVSAKAGTGIKELLDLILLVAQMKELKSEPAAPLEAVVIETRLDKGKGMVATVIVKKGTMKFGTQLFEENTLVAKVRAMFDEHGVGVAAAGPSKPVEILGFTKLPQIGAVIRGYATAPSAETQKANAVLPPAPLSAQNLPDWLKPVSEQEKEKLDVVLKGDTAGSLEAIIASLDPRVNLIKHAIGDISEADVLLARGTHAFIVGFNVSCPTAVVKLAQTEKVIYRTYTIIYELLDELAEVVSGMKEVLTQERELGNGIVIAEFPYEKSRIAGTRVLSGRLARGDSVKVMRAEAEVGRAKIKSIHKGKEEMTKVEKGGECGVLLDRTVAFELNDGIIAVTTG
jgi:translation initiation factor IF-2